MSDLLKVYLVLIFILPIPKSGVLFDFTGGQPDRIAASIILAKIQVDDLCQAMANEEVRAPIRTGGETMEEFLESKILISPF